MIKNLEVKNFKSLKHLKLDCKRVNVFIGKPNTGKSNILESVGIFSILYKDIAHFIRFENMTNLFYDGDTSEKIQITADDIYGEIKFENGRFIGRSRYFDFSFDYTGGSGQKISGESPFKFYKFGVLHKFPTKDFSFLLPPRGKNLLTILQTNKSLKKAIDDIFYEFGLQMVFEPQEGNIKALKKVGDELILYPYSLVSDTLQRVVFHLAAIETNKDSIIIFEEPEAHAFPYYTKFLAERIAMNGINQYFISTHNPYFLLSVLEKTPKDEIGIFITYFEDYQTKVRPLSVEEMPEILDLDASVFFNLDRFLEKE
ncbi:MAG: AAA family ATPase [Candidatus Edwardsbacteria bacterium]